MAIDNPNHKHILSEKQTETDLRAKHFAPDRKSNLFVIDNTDNISIWKVVQTKLNYGRMLHIAAKYSFFVRDCTKATL